MKVKKGIAVVMAAAMLAGAMTVNAGATYSSDQLHITPDTAANTGEYGIVSTNFSPGDTIGTGSATVKFNNGVSGSITNVYAVSFTPDELTFTYGGGAQYIWNPEDQKYETITPGGDSWTPVTNTITITNYSDLPIDVEATFAKSADVTQTVTATFTDTDPDTQDDGILSLASAVATGNLGANGTPTTGKFTMALSGSLGGALYPNGTVLGTITLTLKVPTT